MLYPDAPFYMDKREWILHYAMNYLYPSFCNYKDPVQLLSVITPTNKSIYLDNILENYANQSYLNKELILVLHNNGLQYGEWAAACSRLKNIRIYQLDDDLSLGDCLNYAVEQANGDIVAKFDDDDYYGPGYLQEAVNCFQYTEAAIVGKVSHFVYFENSMKLGLINKGQGFQYLDYLFGGTHVVKREVFEKIKFRPISLGEDCDFNFDCRQNGYLLYACGPMNYVRVRRYDKIHHAWKLEDDDFEGGCSFIASTPDFRAYANG
ncbi:MAG: glycosyltransferase [Bacillota bacterium]